MQIKKLLKLVKIGNKVLFSDTERFQKIIDSWNYAAEKFKNVKLLVIIKI